MNLPNRLTAARILLAPVFLILLMVDFPCHYLAAGLVFGAAALTDLFDGKIARGRGLVTNLGKFLDPIADKMLTTAAFLGFLAVGKLDVFAVMLILSTLAQGGEVITSRGELVEIGGSFRVPDIMELCGCHLREVGTTNKTHLSDYERAIGEQTRALLKVHTSNYRIVGLPSPCL